MTEEIWKPITGFEDYEISESGHIRSKTHNKRMIQPYGTKYGLFVDLQGPNGVRRTIGLNALMKETFGKSLKPKNIPKLDESTCEAWL